MTTAELQEIMSWVRGTDLVELSFKEAGKGFSLATGDEAALAAAQRLPASRFVAVRSPGLGLFQWSPLGQARRAEEGAEVASGDSLGLLEAGKGKALKVQSPCAGRVARCFIDAGEAVEYGQLLFFLEPAA